MAAVHAEPTRDCFQIKHTSLPKAFIVFAHTQHFSKKPQTVSYDCSFSISFLNFEPNNFGYKFYNAIHSFTI